MKIMFSDDKGVHIMDNGAPKICPYCGYEHLNEIHSMTTPEATFHCPVCGKMFRITVVSKPTDKVKE